MSQSSSSQPIFNDQSAASGQPAPAKPPVVRGARACTVCRQAKMKCVGAEDGTQPCQRCKRSGNTCVFEKHRRGRKPGSKLSEASKMLRRLEKGLTTAKAKRPPNNITLPAPVSSSTGYHREISPGNPFHNNELPPILNHPSSCSSDDDMDEDENRDRNHQGMVPAKVINKEKEKSFFNVVMNPHHTEPLLPRSTTDTSRQQSSPSQSPPSGKSMNSPPPSFSDGLFTRSFKDPVAAGLVTDVEVSRLFDLFYLRLNPFINLFDASLHSAEYVREKCSFLFTVIIMAVCKFFKPECYAATRRLAQDMAILAFAEGQQTIEVVQAYMCLTYWKEPEDNRTWTYIGYASRMAVGLELNRYVGKRSTHESDLQMRERRNRERTYLVLFVHDRSLSMQTAKQWMLPEGDLVRHVKTWLEEGGSPIRPEDVIIAAFVELRLIGSEATDSFYKHQHAPASYAVDANHDNELKSCNSKLDAWVEEWLFEMRKAGGTSFHYTFLKFFQFHVRLFLNSFGINGSISQMSRVSPNYVAVKECYNSAMSNLTIVAKDFADMGILRYGQESITVMTAYAAVVLLKLLRSSDSGPSQTEDIYTLINRTASAYEAGGCPSSDTASHHARFLRGLVENDRARQQREMDPYKGGIQHAGQHVSTYTAAGSSTRAFLPSQPCAPGMMPSDNYGPPASNQAYMHPMSSSQVQHHSHSLPGFRQSEYTPSSSESAMRSGYSHPHSQQHFPQQYPTTPDDVNYSRYMIQECGLVDFGMGDGLGAGPSNVSSYRDAPSNYGMHSGHGHTHSGYQPHTQYPSMMTRYPPPYGSNHGR